MFRSPWKNTLEQNMANEQVRELANAFSWLCGWLYFFCWSASFYPQPLKNYQRKTTRGVVPDFALLNVLGFSCYTISTAAFLLSPVIRRQYAARHPVSPNPTVRINDLAFGIHAVILVLITYSQFYPSLWGWKDVGAQRNANAVSRGLVLGSFAVVSGMTVLVLASGNGDGAVQSRTDAWAWIDVIYVISYVKLVLTVFKYLPQLVENYRRQSTVGWSIWQVLFDFAGGILSMAQLVTDSALQSDWSGLTGNPLKLGLSGVSMLFDMLYILQHYVLYPSREETSCRAEENGDTVEEGGMRSERTPLLPGE